MPIIPRVNPAPLPQARLQALPLNRMVPDEAFGGGQGDAMAGLDLSPVHAEAARIAEEEKQKANSIAVTAAGAAASQAMTDTLWGDNGALTKQGSDAFGAPEQARQAYFQKTGQIRATLGNDEQREAFDRMNANNWAAIDEQVQKHVAVQRQKFDTDATDAFVANTQNAAANGYKDQKLVASSIGQITDMVTSYAQRNGWSADQTKEAVAKSVSDTHAAVIERMLADDQDLAAKAYYDQHKDALYGAQATAVDKAVQEGSSRAESQRQADQILKDNPNSLTDAVKAARAIEDPKVRDLTEQRVRGDFAEKAEALRQQREQTYTSASNIVDQTKSTLSIPRADWANFTLEEKRSLRSYAQELQKGTPVVTDPAQYQQLRNLAISEKPDERDAFIHANLLKFADSISKEDMDKLFELQGGLRKGDAKAQETVAGLRTRSQIAKESFDAAIPPPANSPDAKRARNAQLAQFNSALDSRIAQWENDNPGKKAPADVIQRFSDDLVINAVTTTGQQRRVFEAQPSEKLIFSIKDVPYRERQRITTYLSSKGLPVTDANVLKMFTQSIANTVPPGNAQP